MEVALEDLIEPLLCCLPHPKCLRNGREEQFGFAQGGELHEEGAVGEVLKEVCGRLQGEPCLAGPTRPVRVSRRVASPRRRSHTCATSFSRPTSGVGWRGRLLR